MKSYFLLPLIVLASCATAKITSSWTAPSAGATHYQKIMVVSIIRNEDSTLRSKMEGHMVGDLKAIGYNAVAYTSVFTQGRFRNMRYDSVRNILAAHGIDAIITIDLLARENERVYVNEKKSLKPDNTPMGSFWETPTRVSQSTSKTGYYVTATQYYWESKLYDVNSVALMYNAQTTTFDAYTTSSLAHKYGKQIVSDMRKNYLLTAKK